MYTLSRAPPAATRNAPLGNVMGVVVDRPMQPNQRFLQPKFYF